MADGTEQNVRSTMLAQIEADLKKSKTEAFKAKLKELVKKRDEAQKAVNLVSLEIDKALDEFEAGL
jgi:multidrug resistance efflux pump